MPSVLHKRVVMLFYLQCRSHEWQLITFHLFLEDVVWKEGKNAGKGREKMKAYFLRQNNHIIFAQVHCNSRKKNNLILKDTSEAQI